VSQYLQAWIMERLYLPLRYDMKLYVDSCARTVNIEDAQGQMQAGREGAVA
jgi:hypothetical protein